MKKCHKEKANSLTICNQVERLKIKENQKRRWNCELTKGKEIDEQFGKKKNKKRVQTKRDQKRRGNCKKKTEKKNQLNNYEKKNVGTVNLQPKKKKKSNNKK